MKLAKYYLDVVGEEGKGCICYAARLDGFGVKILAGGTLAWSSDPAEAPRQKRSLRCSLPERDEGGLRWDCDALDACGTWRGAEFEVPPVTLWEGRAGSVRWEAFAPCARAHVRLGAQSYAGLGYAERLELDVLPWELPIDTLLWGRFAAEGQSLVWIEWEHRRPRRWLWHNGMQVEPRHLGRQGIAWDHWSLSFDESRPLRTGRLSETVLARWPTLGRLLPSEIKALDETKFLTRGTLYRKGRREAAGFVIHERVHFR